MHKKQNFTIITINRNEKFRPFLSGELFNRISKSLIPNECGKTSKKVIISCMNNLYKNSNIYNIFIMSSQNINIFATKTINELIKRKSQNFEYAKNKHGNISKP